jgi:hypothetical protein
VGSEGGLVSVEFGVSDPPGGGANACFPRYGLIGGKYGVVYCARLSRLMSNRLGIQTPTSTRHPAISRLALEDLLERDKYRDAKHSLVVVLIDHLSVVYKGSPNGESRNDSANGGPSEEGPKYREKGTVHYCRQE